MRKSLLVIMLACVMIFSFAATAMADHSPDYYFNFAEGHGMLNNAAFQTEFPTTWTVDFQIDNGTGTSPHSGYSQSTAKCGVCHAVHRAPTLGTSTYSNIPGTPGYNGATGTGVQVGRYTYDAWTADASTQMLLRSTVANACIYCHIVTGAPDKMYGGDATEAMNGQTQTGWGLFYGHTAGCTSCHAVHGANTFKSADGTVDPYILKYKGVKSLGTIALKVQPEVYGTTYAASGASQVETGSLYTSQANMIAGTLSPTAVTAGVTPLQGAVTAQCTVCHASYAVGEETINANYLNAELFQPGTWATANGSTAKIFVGNAANPVSVLPGIAGLTYTATAPGNITGAAGSVILAYKNHPMNAGTSPFKGAGASAAFTSSDILISSAGSSSCQSCHNAPTNVVVGGYVIQAFPHYTPGYYKQMVAENQAAYDTPATLADIMDRRAFYNGFGRPGKPAVSNDGYCTKCHGLSAPGGGVGTMY